MKYSEIILLSMLYLSKKIICIAIPIITVYFELKIHLHSFFHKCFKKWWLKCFTNISCLTLCKKASLGIGNARTTWFNFGLISVLRTVSLPVGITSYFPLLKYFFNLDAFEKHYILH